jgi:tRNA(Ile)-lysidine synthase
VQGIIDRLRTGHDFVAVACGARLQATGDTVELTREAGEFRRSAAAAIPLAPGQDTVWDGRWLLRASDADLSVGPAAGRLARLSRPDRARLQALTPAARGGRPVLIRNADDAPVLAETQAETHALVGERLALALDRMTHERDLGDAIHGATPRNHLFSGADISE